MIQKNKGINKLYTETKNNTCLIRQRYHNMGKPENHREFLPVFYSTCNRCEVVFDAILPDPLVTKLLITAY